MDFILNHVKSLGIQAIFFFFKVSNTGQISTCMLWGNEWWWWSIFQGQKQVVIIFAEYYNQ